MKYKSYIVATAVSFLLAGCGIYDKYEKKVEAPADVFGTTQDITSAGTDHSLAQMS